jgi:hypothetical protein
VYAAHKASQYPVQKSVITEMRDYESTLGLNTTRPYKEFRERVEDIKTELTGLISGLKKDGKLIYVYGASTKGNVLLNYFKLDHSFITAAADRNSKKWGCMTPGTHIPIVSEESARIALPHYFLVLPWHFQDEFVKRESEYLKYGGKFIFPLPKISIVG